MSQYGANYPQEQQPQGPYVHQNPSCAPPPYSGHNYPYENSNQYYTQQPQYQNIQPGYKQASEFVPTSNVPQGHTPPHSQYQTEGANSSYYSGEPISDQNGPDGVEGEKGLGSTIVGGTVGGIAGHKMGGGWGTAAGAALGAVGMNVVSHKLKLKPAPVQQVVAAPQPQVQYVAAPGMLGSGGVGLLGRRQARLSNRAARRGLLI